MCQGKYKETNRKRKEKRDDYKNENKSEVKRIELKKMKNFIGFPREKRRKMKNKKTIKTIFIGIALLFWSGTVWANPNGTSSVEVILSVDKPEVKEREDIRLTLQIKKVDDNVLVSSQGIEIPGIENFAQIGTSNSTNIQVINGKSLVLSEFTKVLIPKTRGTFSLGPAKIPIKSKQGKTEFVESNAIQVVVKPALQGNQNQAKPTLLGDDTGIFQPDSDVEVNILPQGNTAFWLQIAGLVFGLWMVWFFVNKKIEQRRNPLRQKKEGQIEKKEEEPSLPKVEIPDSADPEFLEKIKKIITQSCIEKLNLDLAEITKRDILPKARSVFSEETAQLLKEILDSYEKARFAKLQIDQKVLRDQVELWLQKIK